MKRKLTWALILVAAAAVLSSVAAAMPQQASSPIAAPAPIRAYPAPLIATPSPAPVIALPQSIIAGVAGSQARLASAHVSSLRQYVTLGLDSAPVAPLAPVAVVDTAVGASGRALAGRVHVASGSAAAGPNEHGSLISAAITSFYSPVAHSNGGAATGSSVTFYGCALAGGIDLDCALAALQGAHGVRAINMSFETSAAIPAGIEASWQQAVDAARARGIVVVAAAGDGPGLPFPARLSGVVSVSRTAVSGAVVNPSARAAAPGSALVVVNGAGQLVGTSGSSYSAAYVTALVSRIAGARPDLSADQLAAAVSGRAAMPLAAHLAGIKLAPIARPGCVRITVRGNRRSLAWGRAAKAVAWRVRVGSASQLVKVRSITTARAGAVSVQAVGVYGTFGPPALACR